MLAELLAAAGEQVAVPDGAADLLIEGAEEIERGAPGQVVLAGHRRYAEQLAATNASAAVVSPALADMVPQGTIALVANDPQALFTDFLDQLYPDTTRALLKATCQPGARAWFEAGVTLGPNAVVGPEAEIGHGTLIGPGAVVGAGVTIGRNCLIGPGASIECAHLGDDVVIHAGARIGTEGFGWLDHGKSNRKVPQLGRVIIQDRVEIGANSTVDRGALGDTVIGEGTKIDNLVQIGHNCRIGRDCLIAATTGISGSTIIGDSVLIGGGVGTSGHLTIGSGSYVHGRAAVTKDWPEGSKLAGAPAQDIKEFWKELAMLRRLAKGDRP